MSALSQGKMLKKINSQRVLTSMATRRSKENFGLTQRIWYNLFSTFFPMIFILNNIFKYILMSKIKKKWYRKRVWIFCFNNFMILSQQF